MLREMRIRNLGVIEDAVLELSPGLNVVTGETGAGKTMVVTGLGLLFGKRADAALVRTDARSAAVEGILELPLEHPAVTRAVDAGADEDDVADGLILARSVGTEGRSRAHVAGRSVPAGVLADIAQSALAVHGQADQWRLRRPEQHRAAVDAAGGTALAALLERYRSRWGAVRELEAELARLTTLEQDHGLEAEVLRAGLAELEQVDPRPGEEDELRIEEDRLAFADRLLAAAAEAHRLLSGGDTAGGPVESGGSDLLASAAAALAGASGHDPDLAALEDRCRELGYLSQEISAALGAYLAGIDADPARLEAVQDRRAQVARVTRAHGGSVSATLAWGQTAALRLDELESAPQRATELAETLQAQRSQLAECAVQLSQERAVVAARLGTAIQDELAHLAMGNAAVQVNVGHQASPDGLVIPGEAEPVRYGPDGIDDVEIRLAANPGAPARSVAKAASGGELSRVMLALELVTGGQDVPTFVFDEVDAGVGGRAALDLGARLGALAQHAQVIVVTHLAQVAAFADRHLVVRKTSDGAVTSSDVAVVSGDDRLRELARMMAGVEDSAAALEHAEDLLARAVRPSPAGPAGSSPSPAMS